MCICLSENRVCSSKSSGESSYYLYSPIDTAICLLYPIIRGQIPHEDHASFVSCTPTIINYIHITYRIEYMAMDQYLQMSFLTKHPEPSQLFWVILMLTGYPSGPQVLATAVNCPEEAGLALLRREAGITVRFWSFGLVDRGKSEGKTWENTKRSWSKAMVSGCVQLRFSPKNHGHDLYWFVSSILRSSYGWKQEFMISSV